MMYDNYRPNSALSTATRWFGAGLFLAAILLYLFLPFISFSPTLFGTVSFGEISVSGIDLTTGHVTTSGLADLLSLGNGLNGSSGLNGSAPSGLPVVTKIVGGVLIIPGIVGLLMAAPSRARTRAIGSFLAAVIGLVLIVVAEVVFNVLATHYINQSLSSDPSQSDVSAVMTVLDQAIGPGIGFWAVVATLLVLAVGSIVAMVTLSRQQNRPQYPVGYGPAPGYGPVPGYPPPGGYPYQPGQYGSGVPGPY